MNSKAACSVSKSTALSLCASQTKFSAKCGGDKMFNQAKKNNSSDNFVLSSFPSKYANRFWRGFYTIFRFQPFFLFRKINSGLVWAAGPYL